MIRRWELAFLLVGMALWAGWQAVKSAPEPVSVLPIRMDTDCVRDAQAVLTRQRVAHNVAPMEDGILVRPDDRPRAQMELALAGLPRHRPPIRDDWGCDGGPTEELLRKWARKAEEQTGRAISLFPGVQGATVRIKRAEEHAFADVPKPNRVTVWLRLGASLHPAHLAAIRGLALVGYYDIRCPVEVEIRELTTGRLLGSANLGYSRGPERHWQKF